MKETIDINHPQLWWPSGYGEQPLYELRAKVKYNDRQTDEKSIQFGVRTVRILQLQDEAGSPEYLKSIELKKAPHLIKNDMNEIFSGFILLVNGTPIMCKGANWVPPEPFASDVKNEKVLELLQLAKDGNMNMLRVWGGGIYESDYFYDQCDKFGILVTQDFLMACAKYPEDEDWFIDRLAKEAEQAAKRLRNHPSLVWWTGDNENGGLDNEDNANYPGRKIAMNMVMPILEKFDHERKFMPTSPYGGYPNMSATRGTTHNTFYLENMANYIKSSDFKDYKTFFEGFLARFVPEEPVMGAPSVISLRKFMTDDEIFGDSDEAWRFHTRNHPAPEFKEFGLLDMLVTMAEKLFGSFESKEDRLFKMQVVQYEWIRITMENFRRNKWYSSGILYWMFNDCWPASGWAITDYYCLPKAGYYGFKRSAKGVIASIDKKDGIYTVYICNDLPNTVKCKLKFYLQSTKDKQILIEYRGKYQICANTSELVLRVEEESIDAFMTDSTILLCDIKGDFGEDRAFFIPTRPQDIHSYNAKVEVLERTEYSITLKSNAFVYVVRLDGAFVFEDNFFMMLPNETKTVNIKPSYSSDGNEIEVNSLY